MITRRELLQATAAAAVAATHGPARAQTVTDALFPGFKALDIKTSGATIHAVTGGSGPPVLLMHGYPQTHVLWHKVAPTLAKKFSVVAADLRGYGDSSKPDGGGKHINYSKRAMALDMAEVMRSLGFDTFAVGRTRPRRPRGASSCDGSRRQGHQARDAGHRADVRHVPAREQGIRYIQLSLVLPDPACAVAGNAHRQQR